VVLALTTTGIETSQQVVIVVTARRSIPLHNCVWEAFMPILMVALIALAAFGVIGVFLGAAVVLEQRKLADKPHTGKAA
jgi:ABC-type dipeptide/oligopeptide/nickel transport system permease component